MLAEAEALVARFSVVGRFDRRRAVAALAAKPGRCAWAGGRCAKHAVVGDGSEEPRMPDLPAACPDCGRPVAWFVVVLVGVDASRL